MKLISLTGSKLCGKDTAYKILRKHYKSHGLHCKDISFADPIRSALSTWFHWDRERLNNDVRYKEGSMLDSGKIDPVCERLGMNRREILQKFGSDVMRDNFFQEFWIFCLELDLRFNRYDGVDVGIITDTRFLNELNFVRDRDGLCLRIDKEVIGEGGFDSSIGVDHKSENEWKVWTSWDGVVKNVIDKGESYNYNLENLLRNLIKFTDPYVLK